MSSGLNRLQKVGKSRPPANHNDENVAGQFEARSGGFVLLRSTLVESRFLLKPGTGREKPKTPCGAGHACYHPTDGRGLLNRPCDVRGGLL